VSGSDSLTWKYSRNIASIPVQNKLMIYNCHLLLQRFTTDTIMYFQLYIRCTPFCTLYNHLVYPIYCNTSVLFLKIELQSYWQTIISLINLILYIHFMWCISYWKYLNFYFKMLKFWLFPMLFVFNIIWQLCALIK